MAYINLQTSETSTSGSTAQILAAATANTTLAGGNIGSAAFLSGDLTYIRGSFRFNAEDASASIPVSLKRIVPGTLNVRIIGTTAPSYVPNFYIAQELDNTGVVNETPPTPNQDGLMTINNLLTITRSVTGDSGLQVAFEIGGTQ